MKRARLTVALSKASTKQVTVAYATQNGTAIAGTHYTAKTGTLTFAPGVTTQDVLIEVNEPLPTSAAQFSVVLTAPVNATLLRSTGFVVLSEGGEVEVGSYLARFNWSYDMYHDRDNGYFGPTTGPNAFRVPYHAKERAIIVEAPDWTHESVSETVSFQAKAAAWKYLISGDATDLTKCWSAINDIWIPQGVAQPWGDYTPNSPAGYMPDPMTLQDSPMAASTARTSGPDPLYTALTAAYGKTMYLMHWLIDVDGDYGFKNPDGGTKNVYINNYQRGPIEDGLATITHGCFDDYANGGASNYGFQGIYNREQPLYPDSLSQNGYSKQVNYSMAGDADVRAVGSTMLALRHAPGGIPAIVKNNATKNAAFIQYTLYDKYFQPIPGYDQSGCHYLLSWGCGFGVGLVEEGATNSYWGFRIGNSEIHHGYNGIDVAYAARTGAELASTASGVPARWSISLDRQLELLRWLQSPEGAIAGGVTSNWRGRYETPTDGRQNATFYGMYYNYSPSWYNPPSNNWAGFQYWGVQRLSEVAIHAAEKGMAEADIYTRCMVILDKWIPWFYDNCEVTVEPDRLSYPTNTRWTSDTIIAGVTASQPAAKYLGLPINPPVAGPDVYEYLPSMTWPGSSPDYAAFWSGSGSVPNPNLHCVITETGWDPGTAAGAAQILIQYCAAKKIKAGGVLSGTVPNTSIQLTDVLQMALDIMDVVWRNRDDEGFGSVGEIAISRLNDVLWIPTEFGTGYMPNGEILANGQTTFWSMRKSFYMSTEKGPEVQAWLQGGMDPEVSIKQPYHRYWNGVDVAVAFGMIHFYFPDAEPDPNSELPGSGGAETGAGH